MNSPKIIPFGKYKGKPVEVLQQDHDYAQWLMAQPWFRERFQPVYNLIVNNFGEPAETPEHNALQALFLENRFCAALTLEIWHKHGLERLRVDQTDRAARLAEKYAAHAEQCERAASEARYENFREVYRTKAEAARLRASAIREALRSPEWGYRIYGKRFEEKGVDVAFVYHEAIISRPKYPMPDVRDGNGPDWGELRLDNVWELRVEIKPILADDYPAVLRQMRANGCDVLFTSEYLGEGATLEQVRKMFASAGIALLLRADVERVLAELP